MKNVTREDIEQERASLRERFGEAYSKLEALLFAEDPIGINFGHNTDEYDPEVRTILPKLGFSSSKEDVLTVVHAEFCRWFGAEIAGPRERFARIAARIVAELPGMCGVSNREHRLQVSGDIIYTGPSGKKPL